jgi:signal peptidase I
MSPGQNTASADAQESLVPPSPTLDRRRPRRLRAVRVVVAVAVLVLVLMARAFVVQSFYIPSGSMEPTLKPHDRILVNMVGVGSSLRRGDVVVFDGTRAFAGHALPAGPDGGSTLSKAVGAMASLLSIRTNETDFVKRVVGLPGDHVVCCSANGLLSVNGTAVNEAYVYPGDKPSDLTFDVTVPPERIWVMGDHRSDSSDSRAHLGDPGGGMVRLDDVIGRVWVVYWPLSRAGVKGAPDSLRDIPASTVGERHN